MSRESGVAVVEADASEVAVSRVPSEEDLRRFSPRGGFRSADVALALVCEVVAPTVVVTFVPVVTVRQDDDSREGVRARTPLRIILGRNIVGRVVLDVPQPGLTGY